MIKQFAQYNVGNTHIRNHCKIDIQYAIKCYDNVENFCHQYNFIWRCMHST